jgi:nickel-type superoxide dismutase maturation protease
MINKILGWRFGRVAVHGPSMAPHLKHGDWVIVRCQVRPRVGDVALVRLPDGGLAVKRLIRRVRDGWWVEGDNAYASTDSRQFGAIPEDAVLGRVIFRYWPLRRRA